MKRDYFASLKTYAKRLKRIWGFHAKQLLNASETGKKKLDFIIERSFVVAYWHFPQVPSILKSRHFFLCSLLQPSLLQRPHSTEMQFHTEYSTTLNIRNRNPTKMKSWASMENETILEMKFHGKLSSTSMH